MSNLLGYSLTPTTTAPDLTKLKYDNNQVISVFVVNSTGGGGSGSTIDISTLAKEAKQDSQITIANSANTKLDSIITNTSGLATSAKQDSQIILETSIRDRLSYPGGVVGSNASGTVSQQLQAIYDATNNTASRLAPAVSPADAETNGESTSSVRARNFGYNGTTWDRLRSGIFGVVSGVSGYQNTINVGRYNATAPTLTDGQFINHQMNVRGALVVAQDKPAPITETSITGTTTGSTPSRSNSRDRVNVQAVVTNYTTQGTIQIDTSNNGTNWTNISPSNTATTISANGSYAFDAEFFGTFVRATKNSGNFDVQFIVQL